jgi:imidazolonepropionase-like amidohydrolase
VAASRGRDRFVIGGTPTGQQPPSRSSDIVVDVTTRFASSLVRCSLAAAVAVVVGATTPVAQSTTPVTAVVDTSVIPMDTERVLTHHTVLVRDGRITWVGPAAAAEIPAGAARIDGRDRFLLPGLADMHVHIAPGAGQADDAAGRVLRLLLAHGVTTVRSMIGHPTHLALRAGVSDGTVLGPTIVAAGPPLWGRDVPTPDVARQIVAAQAAAGYDFVKVISGFSPPVYDAIVAAAREARLPVGGHVSGDIDLPRALAAGQQIEHLDAYLEALVAGGAPVRRSASQLSPGAILDHIEAAKIPGVVAAVRRSGVYNSPTLALFARVASDETADVLAARPEMRYVTPQALAAWREQITAMRAEAPSAARRARFVAIRGQLAKALHDGGAPLLAGSDSPQMFLVAGSALHEELAALVAAGLPPYAALRAATAAPAEYLRQRGAFGVVAAGARADLILVAANPLEHIAGAARIDGVMVRGRWIDAAARQRLLDEVAASAAAAR